MTERRSLWSEHPDYRVELVPEPRRMRVRVGDTLLAESARALRVEETRHDPVWYFPRADVHMRHLRRSDHETFCPFKGVASYWSIAREAGEIENAVWSYDAPFPEVAGLRDHVAFWLARAPELVLEPLD